MGGALRILLLIGAGEYPAEVLAPVEEDSVESVRYVNYEDVGEGVRGFEGVEGYE